MDKDFGDLVAYNMDVYQKAVNQDRAIPDARTGLKPIHTKILWEMYKDKVLSTGRYTKCAYMVGQIISRFSEHGDTSAYEAMMRLSQNWILPLPLVDAHGNNGSQLGDGPAAMRYVEARLTDLVEKYMMDGIYDDAVDFEPNFTNTEEEPSVLPSVFPGLFCVPTQGIGYACASNFLTFNLTETIDAISDYLRGKPWKTLYYDLASGGTLINPQDMPTVAKNGNGTIYIDSSGTISKNVISFTEFPFNVAVEDIVDDIVKACENDKIKGIREVQNTSGDGNVSISVILDPGEDAQKKVNELLAKTKLRSSYGINQTALVNGVPKVISQQEMADIYISHNLECIRRVATHSYNESLARCSILSGFLFAITHIDDVVQAIKSSKSRKDAKLALISLGLKEDQADAVLDMRLAKLTGMEKIAVEDEYDKEQGKCIAFKHLMDDEELRKKELLNKLAKLKKDYPVKRRTKIAQKDISKEKKSTYDDTLYAYSWDENGYVTKRISRNGDSATAMDHEGIIVITNEAKVYRLLGSDFSVERRTNALGLLENAKEPMVVLATASSPKDFFIVTRMGYVKKMNTSEFNGDTRNLAGISAIKLKEDDTVVKVFLLDGNDKKVYTHIYIHTNKDMGILFSSNEVPLRKKASNGVIGIKLADDDFVTRVRPSDEHLNVGVTPQRRGGKGMHHPTLFCKASVT